MQTAAPHALRNALQHKVTGEKKIRSGTGMGVLWWRRGRQQHAQLNALQRKVAGENKYE
jgi:hypothetical protein